MTTPTVTAVRAVCFDLDGCLVDSRGPISAGINHALDAVGLARRPEAELHQFIGPPLLATMERLLGEGGGDPARGMEAVDHYRAVYPEIAIRDTVAFPGIQEILAWLAARMPMMIVTSKPHAYARPIAAAAGVLDFFEDLYGPDLDALTEPKSAKLHRALEDLGMANAPGSVAMVGDTQFDVEAGIVCGTRTVGVLWGIGDEDELRHAGAQALATTPGELPKLLGVPLS